MIEIFLVFRWDLNMENNYFITFKICSAWTLLAIDSSYSCIINVRNEAIELDKQNGSILTFELSSRTCLVFICRSHHTHIST